MSPQKSFPCFWIYCFCSKMVTMATTKYLSHISDVSNFSSIKFYVHIRPTNGNIPDCLFFYCEFIISVFTQLFFSLCKTSETTLRVSLSFFLGKLSKSSSLTFNISRMGILNSLSEEINFFRLCNCSLASSFSTAVLSHAPLSVLTIVMKTKSLTVLANQRTLFASRNVDKNLKTIAKITASEIA